MHSSLPRRVGSCACVGVSFAVAGWFRRFRPSPPPLVLFLVRRPPFFFSLAFSGFARSGPGVLVLVFAPSLFFCVPLPVSRLSSFSPHLHSSHLHPLFILTFTSFARSPPCLVQGVCVCAGVCVCVERLNRRKISLVAHFCTFY